MEEFGLALLEYCDLHDIIAISDFSFISGTHIHRHRLTDTHADTYIHRHTDTDRQTDRQTNRHTHTLKNIDRLTDT